MSDASETFDFLPIGQAIKKAREKKELTSISTDQYIFSDKQIDKTSLRKQVDTLLDAFNDKKLTVIEGTAKGICKAKEPEE